MSSQSEVASNRAPISHAKQLYRPRLNVVRVSLDFLDPLFQIRLPHTCEQYSCPFQPSGKVNLSLVPQVFLTSLYSPSSFQYFAVCQQVQGFTSKTSTDREETAYLMTHDHLSFHNLPCKPQSLKSNCSFATPVHSICPPTTVNHCNTLIQ